ncbi:MAG: nucleotidyltransferase family protein [Kiritimatiellae bacterium]|nr:nucleotidyltransferase family protein [Kiritimatiellia bacterium]
MLGVRGVLHHQLNIPDAWRLLIECIRCAIHGSPPSDGLKNIDWAGLLGQARAHSIECYLFPWLCCHLPDQFSASASVAADSPQAAWRAIALEHLKLTLIRQQQTAQVLEAFANKGVAVVPLKGAWLSEEVYPEPSQRSMVDLDLLVRPADIEQAHLSLSAIGYHSQHAQLGNKHIYDCAYYHPDFRTFIELHWNVESEMIPGAAIPDIERVWERTYPAEILGQSIQAFTLEDQLSHLTQHIFHHRLAVSLKSYIDIALLLQQRGCEISVAELKKVALFWKTELALPVILEMVAQLFSIVLPAQIREGFVATDQELVNAACQSLFELSASKNRAQEHNLLHYRQASAAGKLKLILGRVCMPQSFMVLHYPFARHHLLLPSAWLLRAIKLTCQTGRRLICLKQSGSMLDNAAVREMIVKKLTPKDG